MNEETIARVGPQRHNKKTDMWKFSFISASTPYPNLSYFVTYPLVLTKNLSAMFVSSQVGLERSYCGEARTFCLLNGFLLQTIMGLFLIFFRKFLNLLYITTFLIF
jgi:hypothetical protein